MVMQGLCIVLSLGGAAFEMKLPSFRLMVQELADLLESDDEDVLPYLLEHQK